MLKWKNELLELFNFALMLRATCRGTKEIILCASKFDAGQLPRNINIWKFVMEQEKSLTLCNLIQTEQILIKCSYFIRCQKDKETAVRNTFGCYNCQISSEALILHFDCAQKMPVGKKTNVLTTELFIFLFLWYFHTWSKYRIVQIFSCKRLWEALTIVTMEYNLSKKESFGRFFVSVHVCSLDKMTCQQNEAKKH